MTAAIKTQTQKYTVRANRGKARIWIQGKRLAEAGFKPGRHYIAHHSPGATQQTDMLEMVLIATTNVESNKDAGYDVRKVSGKGDLPIIDLSGKGARPFQTGDDVEVIYQSGMIVIRRAAQ